MIQRPRIQLCFALLVALGVAQVNAQQPHHLMSGRMTPGNASHIKLMGNPHLAMKVQPVKLIGPVGSQLSVVSGGGFVSTMRSEHTAGMQLGNLYRFQIANVGGLTKTELYPSVELLDHLHPPVGLENEFPIPIVITESDIRHAMEGRLVTKVIYLEDSETALPRGGKKEDQPWFDVSAVEDPVRAAEGLGRPMAILRIGSRVPTPEELGNMTQNAFNSATPTMVSEGTVPELRMNMEYQSPAIPAADANTESVLVPGR